MKLLRADRKPRVLILYPTATFIDPILKIAALLQSEGGFDVIIYSHSWYPGFEDTIQRANALGVRVLCFMNPDRKSYRNAIKAIDDLGLPIIHKRRPRKTVEVKRAEAPPRIVSLLRLYRMLPVVASFRSVCEEFDRSIRINSSILTRADLVIDRLDIDLLIVATESVSHQSTYFIESMSVSGKRSIYVPLTVSSHNEIDAWLSNTRSGEVRSFGERLFALRYPRWKRSISGVPFTRLPAGKAMSFEYDGLAPRHPWLSFTMRSDVVACASPFMRDRLVELGAGYRRGAMLITGSAEDSQHRSDSAHRATLRRELIEMHGLDPRKPILLFSVPSNVSNQYPLGEFGSFDELISYWCSSFRILENVSVVMSPHPWYRNNDQAGRLIQSVGLNLIWRGVIDLMPAADVFSTFGASSTPRLAAAAGLPVLNYLAFKASFSAEDAKSYFVGFDTMPVARSKAEWEALLSNIDREEYRADLCRRAREKATYFGSPDDGFRRRFVPVAQRLAKGRGALTKKDWKALRTICPDPVDDTDYAGEAGDANLTAGSGGGDLIVRGR